MAARVRVLSEGRVEVDGTALDVTKKVSRFEGEPLTVAALAQLLYDHAYTQGSLENLLPNSLGQLAGKPGGSAAYPDRNLEPEFVHFLNSGTAPPAPTTKTRGLPMGGKIAEGRGWVHFPGTKAHKPGSHGGTRIYWDLTRFGAGQFVKALTTSLDALEIPHHLKVISDPQNYKRVDGGVLYLERSDVKAAGPELRKTFMTVRKWMGDRTPLLTKEVAPGVGVADDLPGESFGSNRMRLLARSLWEERGESASVQRRTDRIRELFEANKLDPALPFLGPSRVDDYARWVE